MKIRSVKLSATFATLVVLVAFATQSRAQDSGSMPAVPQTAPAPQDAAAPPAAAVPQDAAAPQAAAALTGDQQTAANSALCSALASHVPNPASATPSALSDPSLISTAAASFAGSTSLPLPSATSMLQGYVAQHATDILASCAVTNATGSVTSKIPGASNLPSVPGMP